MDNKNIVFNHTIEQYNKKYENLNYRLLRVTKKEVEDFDKTHNTKKGYLLEGRKWWLIKDTYYQIPKPPRFMWFINLNRWVKYSCGALILGGVTCAIVLPLTLRQPSNQTKLTVDKIHEFLKKNEDKVHTCYDAINGIKDNLKIDIINAKLESSGQEYVFDSDKKEVVVIEDDKLVYGPNGYTLSDKNHIWKFVSTIDSNTEYSQYLKDSNEPITEISVKSGVDVGNHNEVKNIHYKNDSNKAKEVIFRTFDYSNNESKPKVNLTIRAFKDEESGDTVHHYGDLANLYIVSNAMHSYHEFGEVTWAEVYEGALSLDKNEDYKGSINKGLIKNVEIKPTEVNIVELKSTGGEVENLLSTDQNVIDQITSKITPKTTPVVKTEQQIKDAKKEEFNNPDTPPGVINVYDSNNSLVEYYSSFNEFASASNSGPTLFTGQTIKLSCDYDMSNDCSEGWTPICQDTGSHTYSFEGTFDGQNHTISNFNTYNLKKCLFGSSKGDLKNLTFKNSEHIAQDGGGNAMLCCYLLGDANVENIHMINCKVSGTSNTALMVSWIDNPSTSYGTHKISNCTIDKESSATTSGGSQVGGILGQSCFTSNLEMSNCINYGTISGKGSVGGIVAQYGAGTKIGVFKNCVNYGTVTTTNSNKAGNAAYSGGLIGYCNSGSCTNTDTLDFSDCANYGNVTSVVPEDKTHIIACGGFYGYCNVLNTTFTNCKNFGNIGLIEGSESTYKVYKAGGFVGCNNGNTSESFVNCENNGVIHISTQTTYSSLGVGHFAGSKQSNQTATNCKHDLGRVVDEEYRIIVTGETE